MSQSSLRQLDIFAQLIASGSFARCAQDLGIAVDIVEREAGSLELRLGYRLFDREGDKVRPTAAGLKTARALTQLSQGTPESWAPPALDAVAPPEPARQSILLAAPAPVFGHFQEALAAFEAANEDIAITLDLGIHLATDAARAFARGTADIAYFYALEDPVDPPARYGWSEQLNLYVGDRHPLASAAAAPVEDVAAGGLLAMEARGGLRSITDAALARAGIDPVRPVLESDNMFDILAALRAGDGCFPAFGPLARDLGRMDGIRRLALDRPLPAIGIWQAVRPEAEGSVAVGALADFLFL
ncbi:MAG: LysR family transcriptional regulator [Sphingobium sp.]